MPNAGPARRPFSCFTTASANLGLWAAKVWNRAPAAPSARGVLFQVAVGVGGPLSPLRGVGRTSPPAVFLTPRAVRTPQGAQALGRLPPLGALVAALRRELLLLVEVVAQVLQVQSPGAELLPVDPLEGHDAVQVPAHLRAGKSSVRDTL